MSTRNAASIKEADPSRERERPANPTAAAAAPADRPVSSDMSDTSDTSDTSDRGRAAVEHRAPVAGVAVTDPDGDRDRGLGLYSRFTERCAHLRCLSGAAWCLKHGSSFCSSALLLPPLFPLPLPLPLPIYFFFQFPLFTLFTHYTPLFFSSYLILPPTS